MRELEVQNHAALRRVGDAPIRCAMGGVSMMTRKDEARNYLWFDEGLLRLRSQDYRVLCDLAARGQYGEGVNLGPYIFRPIWIKVPRQCRCGHYGTGAVYQYSW